MVLALANSVVIMPSFYINGGLSYWVALGVLLNGNSLSIVNQSNTTNR